MSDSLFVAYVSTFLFSWWFLCVSEEHFVKFIMLTTSMVDFLVDEYNIDSLLDLLTTCFPEKYFMDNVSIKLCWSSGQYRKESRQGIHTATAATLILQQ